MPKVLFSILLAFLFAELLLRIVPFKYTDYNSEFAFVPDQDLGYLPAPDQNVKYNLGCLRNTHVLTNNDGFRGEKWNNGRNPSIALLGDSYLLALTISERLHLASRLNEVSGGEVWNAGVSGYGTYQEYLVWKKFLIGRKPDVTVLFFFAENDIRDNQCDLCKAEGQVYSPCLEMEDGEVVQNNHFEKRPPPQKGLMRWLKDNCFTCRVAKNLLRKDHYRPADGKYFNKESFAYNIYRPQRTPQWEEGWEVTRWAMLRLKQACDSIGSKLIVVNIPGPLRLSNDWRKELQEQIGDEPLPTDFDFDLPLRRLRKMTESAGIATLDLTPAFISYRDRYELPFPGFGWCCDGHWNPLGHRLAADCLYNELQQMGWVKGEALPAMPPPKAILGDEMFEEIYGCSTVQLE